MEHIQESLFGRTSPEPSAATKEQTSKPSSKRSAKSQTQPPMFLCLRKNGTSLAPSWATDGAWLSEPWTRNFGEYPSAAVESTLSQILEANAPEKYYLSKKACEGILRRAERRGKVLPQMLKEALEEVCNA